MNVLEQKIDNLARDVLKLSRNTLLVNLRFLDAALSRFELHPYADTSVATDGHLLLYNARHILSCYKTEKEASTRDYLHIVLHCVFQHMFINDQIDRCCWDLACDIATEYTITGLGIQSTTAQRQQRQQAVFSILKAELNYLTAEKIYRYYLNKTLPTSELAELRALFCADDHFLWYIPPEKRELMYSSAINEAENESSNGDGTGNKNSNNNGKQSERNNSNEQTAAPLSLADIAADWSDIARRMQVDIETFSKQKGDKAGGLIQNLYAINREKYDYATFLQKFAVRGEVMKVDDDEFDYIFYTYGLQLYDNMPLIEPLEYKEEKRIREFVIAIDTSGSVAGDTVQRFVQKTFNVLKSTESFFSRINLHIIQCDAGIQEDAVITTQKEFDAYMKTMQIRGLGGTDFRPVFRYVNELIRNHEFSNLKGLIYFTDGFGTFPENKPDYETAFVFLDDEYNNPIVPPWAIKLVLEKEEL